jgi:hypothetical protein
VIFPVEVSRTIAHVHLEKLSIAAGLYGASVQHSGYYRTMRVYVLKEPYLILRKPWIFMDSAQDRLA